MYRFLLSRRWVGLLVFAIIWMYLCVLLGNWQFHRLHERRAQNAQVTRALTSSPVPLSSIDPSGGHWRESKEWTTVTATGRFDDSQTLTVKYLSRDTGTGQGVDVVTPLVLDDGTAILVDRGWLQTNNTGARPKNIPPAATGTVTVTGWLRADSPADHDAVTPYQGQIRAISSRAIEKKLSYHLRYGYLNLRTQTPRATGIKLLAEPKPDMGEGPHLFYGIQWYFFGVLGIAGYFWFARDEAKRLRDEADQAALMSST